ncbi:MAG: oxidoreductase [Rhizobiales bacterium]|uniref:Gfo/Idh/MocA family protein n=1 Tax=unclassified Leeuwenhoekiella TaxID=2615029 RepID=UPI000C465EF9|nr:MULTISPECIES: Gfo/Idh/MocA family oxidoreductase [unclassified Leeuwenhoekiella]MAW94215.1 oxidoreductase [Leeuwenhoekiella sp.]MAW96871.1 oxidoreductase [Leeuwenhoekiella sp.]MBA67590.1 oxidoreductase [Hyphomicrobiales bacterium]|tara:strand:- start:1778 stop:3112 length:1335 start_codon:yes stop_codon:yes gene_type:complete
MSNLPRRKFLQQTTLATAGLSLPGSLLANPISIFGANDRMNFAVIGCNGMGWSNMRAHLKLPNVTCVALADVDQRVLDRRSAEVKELTGKAPKVYTDYRKLLENKDIDAVIIGTPDHWHCLNMVDALQAGKHVYVEKPLANSIEECNVMLKAANASDQLVQVGQWQRSGQQYDEAIKYVQSGKLGQIRLVKCWAYQGWMNPVPEKPNTTPPPGVDYAMWLGPAPERPFNENRFHFNFRWFWDYAGGLMTDWGVHELDIALFAMGAKAPKSILASGGKLAYPDDASETPDTLQTVYEFDNYNLLWEHATGIDGGPYGRTEGIAFIGNNGTLVVNRGGWEVIPEGERKDGEWKTKIDRVELTRPEGNALENHAKNFVTAIRNNDKGALACGVETGSVAAITAHMGNIAFKTGKKIYWDAASGSFNDAEADALVSARYNNGWELPKV